MANQRYRKRKRKTWSRLMLKLMLFCFMCLALTMGATIFFKVETIIVEGNSHYTEEEIIAATNIQLGENLFSIKQNDISKNITYVLPYIQSIEIKLHLPTGIKLVVQEQIGMVQLVTEQGIWYMGVQGKLLEHDSGTNPVVQTETANTAAKLENMSFVQEEVQEEESLGTKMVNMLSWGAEESLELDFDPENEAYISVIGIEPMNPVAGEQIQVTDTQQKQLTALLNFFQELESQGLFQEVSRIYIHPFQYLEFQFSQRFTVKLPLTGDYNYKIRALLSAIHDTESYESGVMDLTQESYVVLFTPD